MCETHMNELGEAGEEEGHCDLDKGTGEESWRGGISGEGVSLSNPLIFFSSLPDIPSSEPPTKRKFSQLLVSAIPIKHIQMVIKPDMWLPQ